MNINDIRHILIIGAGTMGHQIGFLCAVHGYKVSVYDAYPEVLSSAQERTVSLAQRFVKKGQISSEAADQALNRITFTDDPEKAGQNADMVSESIPEDPKLKGDIFARFDRICPPRTIFTTNTSSLVPSMFAKATGRADRFLAFHFHDVASSNIVDVMPHPETSPEAVNTVTAFAEKIGQIPIVLKKEHPGYLFNTMLMAVLDAALSLASKGVACIEDIDRAWMGIMHTASGPFGIMDSVGLDTAWKITSYWAEKSGNPKALKNADFIKSYLNEGKLGRKSGKGFYSYPSPEYMMPDFLKKSSH